MSMHRWSGWPGAWCLDCGCSDPVEQAIADEDIIFVDDPNSPDGIRAEPRNEDVRQRIAAANICPEPGSQRHDPYAARAEGGTAE